MSGAAPILLLTGPPGAGKTTVAQLLAAQSLRAVHVESDRFFGFIATGYLEPWKPEAHEQNKFVMSIVAEAAAAYASAGYLTVVDGILIPGWFFEPLRDALLARGHAVAFAILRAPLAVCRQRVLARSGRALADPRVIEQLWDAFAYVGELERHVIATDGQQPSAIADELAARLRELATDG